MPLSLMTPKGPFGGAQDAWGHLPQTPQAPLWGYLTYVPINMRGFELPICDGTKYDAAVLPFRGGDLLIFLPMTFVPLPCFNMKMPLLSFLLMGLCKYAVGAKAFPRFMDPFP